MFSGGFRGQKLKTSLRLSINRLKLMEKKKTEMALKARKEIADFIQLHKYDRARIRVEHIIREDYLVEAMELIEMYCDLLLARYGLIETMKYCDEALDESVSTIIWATPRLSTDCQELRTVSEQLIFKYGKEFGQQARSNTNSTVNERLIHKLSPDPPPKLLVERYLIEIARNYNVAFDPDPEVMMSEGIPSLDSKEFEAMGGPGGPPDGMGGPPGGMGGPPGLGFNHFNDSNSFGPPPPGGNSGFPGSNFGGGGNLQSTPYPPASNQSGAYPPRDVPPYSTEQAPPYPGGPGVNASVGSGPFLKPNAPPPGISSIPDLPDIPSGNLSIPNSSVGGQSGGGEDVDFDNLTRRFEELKKKK